MTLDRSRLCSLLLIIFFTACSQEPIKKSGGATNAGKLYVGWMRCAYPPYISLGKQNWELIE
jgi:hypothetical protein